MIDTKEWGADFFGSINEMPEESIEMVIGLLESMNEVEAFRSAHSHVLAKFRSEEASRTLEIGCGTAAVLPQLRDELGSNVAYLASTRLADSSNEPGPVPAS
jgi:hypothetical protein